MFENSKKLSLLAVLVGGTLLAAPEYRGGVPAEEVHVRNGIGNFLAKVKSGKAVTVAYLGGSITAQAGWRPMTTAWLQRTYPAAKFKEIHAAIGGTGSDLGVFRLEHDALQYDPDLLFVEFATNDGGAAPESIWRQMEGIVRQTWHKNPATDIVFTYTITAPMLPEYSKGVCPRAASAMEMLADYYGIPSVGFGPRVAAEVKAGRLVMNLADAEKETAVPVDTPKRDLAIVEALAKQGKLLFAKDGVHPMVPVNPQAAEGPVVGHTFYLWSITNAFAKMSGSRPLDHAKQLANPFVTDNLEAAKMVLLEPSMLSGNWVKLPKEDAKMKSFGGRMDEIWHSGTPGDKITFKFKGTCCKIYDLLGPDGGQVWITVDGKKSSKPIPRFDSYCTYHRIATLNVYNGQDGIHTVEIEIDAEQPDRRKVAFRLKDPDKELAESKYQGTKYWASKLMLVGDLVK